MRKFELYDGPEMISELEDRLHDYSSVAIVDHQQDPRVLVTICVRGSSEYADKKIEKLQAAICSALNADGVQ
jgi:hypothetical protein